MLPFWRVREHSGTELPSPFSAQVTSWSTILEALCGRSDITVRRWQNGTGVCSPPGPLQWSTVGQRTLWIAPTGLCIQAAASPFSARGKEKDCGSHCSRFVLPRAAGNDLYCIHSYSTNDRRHLGWIPHTNTTEKVNTLNCNVPVKLRLFERNLGCFGRDVGATLFMTNWHWQV